MFSGWPSVPMDSQTLSFLATDSHKTIQEALVCLRNLEQPLKLIPSITEALKSSMLVRKVHF